MIATETIVQPDPTYEIPPDEPPAARCSYCERPFRTERQCTLHVGTAHGDTCTDEERAAYEEALAKEKDELWLYHAKVAAAIGLTYSAFVIGYLILAG